jgi:hypothetical protein
MEKKSKNPVNLGAYEEKFEPLDPEHPAQRPKNQGENEGTII